MTAKFVSKKKQRGDVIAALRKKFEREAQ